MPHPSRCRTPRFPEDDLLRVHGWEIAERRRGREPLWRRVGRLAVHSEALAEAEAFEAEVLRQLREGKL